MKISMRGTETEQLKVLVTAVREAYKREILDRQSGQRRERLRVLEDLVRKYDSQLNQARQAQKGRSGPPWRRRRPRCPGCRPTPRPSAWRRR
jgi:hypothetical protein